MQDLYGMLINEFAFLDPLQFSEGIFCGEGWAGILLEMCQELEDIGFNGVISNIYNEYGGLRVKFDGYNKRDKKKIEEIIKRAEDRSYLTCEVCADKAMVYSAGGVYLQTLCKHCASNLSKSIPLFIYTAGIK